MEIQSTSSDNAKKTAEDYQDIIALLHMKGAYMIAALVDNIQLKNEDDEIKKSGDEYEVKDLAAKIGEEIYQKMQQLEEQSNPNKLQDEIINSKDIFARAKQALLSIYAIFKLPPFQKDSGCLADFQNSVQTLINNLGKEDVKYLRIYGNTDGDWIGCDRYQIEQYKEKYLYDLAHPETAAAAHDPDYVEGEMNYQWDQAQENIWQKKLTADIANSKPSAENLLNEGKVNADVKKNILPVALDIKTDTKDEVRKSESKVNGLLSKYNGLLSSSSNICNFNFC